MTPHWPDIQDVRRRSIFWIGSIIGRICGNRSISMYETAIVANVPGLRDMQRSEYSDLCEYRKNQGNIFRWILWLGFPSVKGLMPFGW
jgi:hypothetical protein